MDLQEVGWVVDWIDLAQDTNRWRAVVNWVMNIIFYKMRRVSWLAEDLSVSEEELCFVELYIYIYIFIYLFIAKYYRMVILYCGAEHSNLEYC
jgi:hypothetical protein